MSEIPGWFNYAPFWDEAVRTAPEGATIVEVGVFCGKSLAYLAKIAKASGKNLKIVGVDTFRGSPEHHGTSSNLNELPPFALAEICMGHLAEAGVIDDVYLIRADSVRAAKLFDYGGVWACFIDADHSEAAVEADIRAWAPITGCMLGGDDYWSYPGVRAAVDRLLENVTVSPDRCWWWTEPYQLGKRAAK